MKAQLRLYLVTDRTLCEQLGLVETVRQAVAGGVSMVQLRDKTATTAQRVAMAIALKEVLRGAGVPIVINDDVDAALAADIDGAHIGQGDLSPAKARALLGPDKILGLSCETAQAVQAVDNVAIGGLKAKHLADVHASGADGMAVVSAICGQPDPLAAVRAFDLAQPEFST
jgi:thiamine-phosphate pyrophosphorylase